ncbi:hypothetical protein P609_13140 [Comamonas thiooxydans]|nr:hypothetical protein P609_13140 [Comamonas thiooxydans]
MVWPWFFILFGLVAATQGGGAAMAGFCWMLAVNLVQDSASHMQCVMAKSKSSGRCSRRETGL